MYLTHPFPRMHHQHISFLHDLGRSFLRSQSTGMACRESSMRTGKAWKYSCLPPLVGLSLWRMLLEAYAWTKTRPLYHPQQKYTPNSISAKMNNMYIANYNSSHSFLPDCRHFLRCLSTESLQLSYNIQSTAHPISLNHPSKPQIFSVPPNANPLRSLMIPHVFSITETDVPQLAQQECDSGSLNRKHWQCILSALFKGVWQLTVFGEVYQEEAQGRHCRLWRRISKGRYW